MKRGLLFWIIAGVILFHLVVLGIFFSLPALPKAKFIPPRNFFKREEIVVDPEVGTRTTYREFVVSTKFTPLATPGPSPSK